MDHVQPELAPHGPSRSLGRAGPAGCGVDLLCLVFDRVRWLLPTTADPVLRTRLTHQHGPLRRPLRRTDRTYGYPPWQLPLVTMSLTSMRSVTPKSIHCATCPRSTRRRRVRSSRGWRPCPRTRRTTSRPRWRCARAPRSTLSATAGPPYLKMMQPNCTCRCTPPSSTRRRSYTRW